MVEPIRALPVPNDIFSLLRDIPEEVNIPPVEGYEIKLLERCLSHG